MEFAVILDLNGTIVDTEIAYFKAYEEILSKYDIRFTIEQFTEHWSTQGKKLGDYLKKIGREDLLPREKEMLGMKDDIFRNTLAQRARLMPDVVQLLERLKKSGVRIGLDSSTTRENIDTMLRVFGISGFFDQISSGDMDMDEEKYGPVKKKYARMKFLAEKLGCPANLCIVIGDAEKDIKGAKEADMKAIAVPNEYTSKNNFSMADKVVKNLNEIDVKVLQSLF